MRRGSGGLSREQASATGGAGEAGEHEPEDPSIIRMRVEGVDGIDGEGFAEFFEEKLPGDGAGSGEIA